MKLHEKNHVWLASEAYKRTPSMDPAYTVAYKNLMSGLTIYPNPARFNSTVIFPANICGDDLFIRLFDLSGIMLEEVKTDSQTNTLILNATLYSSGTYIVELNPGNRTLGSQK